MIRSRELEIMERFKVTKSDPEAHCESNEGKKVVDKDVSKDDEDNDDDDDDDESKTVTSSLLQKDHDMQEGK